MIYMMYIIYCIKGVQSKLHEIAKMKYFSSLFTGVKRCPFVNLFIDSFLGDIWSTPDDTSIPNHDSLGSGWCQERQTHCPERSLLSPVSPEPHESLCYGSCWTDGRVCDGGVCGVDLSFKRRVDASQFFVQWRPFSDRSPQKPWIEAKVHVEKKFHSPKFPAVHCNPWGFWIQLFSLSGFSKNPKWNLMSHGRRFKEMNQLCSHEFYNLWVEYHEHNPPSLLEQWCMFFGPLFFSAGFPASSIRNAVAGLGFLCGHLLPRCNCPFFYILRIVAKRPWTPPANRYIIRSCGYIHSFPHDQMSPGFKVDLPVKYQKVRGQQVRQREQWFVIGQFVVFPRFNFCWWPQNYTAKLSGFLSNQALLHLQYSYYPVATLDLQLRWWRPGVAETTFS